MSHRSLALTLVLAIFALLASAIAPAAAQTEQTFFVKADATAADLTVLGTAVGSLAGSSAAAEHLPKVETSGYGFRAVDGALEVGVSTAAVTAAGKTVRDPAGEGSLCGIPALGGDAAALEGVLALVDVCSSSYAAVSRNGDPGAAGAAQAGRIAVNGKALADVVFGLVLAPVMEQVGAITAPLEASVVGPVGTALDAVCSQLPPELNPAALVQQAGDAGLPVADVIAALPGGAQIAEAAGDDCLLALATRLDLVGIAVSIVEDTVRAALLDALDQDLIAIDLGASSSSITSSATTVSRSEVQALSITSPSLGFVVDAVEQLLTGTLQTTIDNVTALVPAQLDTVVAAIPALSDVTTPVLDLLDLTGLIDDQPLLQLTVGSSVAEARMPRAGGDVDTSGSSSGVVVVRISPAIAAVLGIDAETTVLSGVDQVIAAGTPLESSIKVGVVEPFAETAGAAGVPTKGVRATATQLALLSGIEALNGGVVLTVSEASAQVGGSMSSRRLPATGSSDTALLLAAGLFAVVGLGVLRLRRSGLLTD